MCLVSVMPGYHSMVLQSMHGTVRTNAVGRRSKMVLFAHAACGGAHGGCGVTPFPRTAKAGDTTKQTYRRSDAARQLRVRVLANAQKCPRTMPGNWSLC